MENDLLQVETEVKEMMTKTQAEYTSSGGDKAKVWDTIQKEVLVTGGKGNRLFVYSTQRGGIWVYRQIKHCIRGEGENIFFFKEGRGELGRVGGQIPRGRDQRVARLEGT